MIAKIVKKIQLRIRCAVAMVRARAASRARIASQPKRLLILCYGNIYRSAFVAARLADRARGVRACDIRCAGFYPIEGRRSSDDFVALARGYGVDLSAHRSRMISADDIAWADAIVIMDRYNWARLAAYGEEALSKVIWLGAFAPSFPLEIRDPYKLPPARVRTIVDQMQIAVDALTARLANSK